MISYNLKVTLLAAAIETAKASRLGQETGTPISIVDNVLNPEDT